MPGELQRRRQRRRRVQLERPHGDVGQAELRLDHLALFGDAQPAVDRTRRLRLNRKIRRTAAAADAAAAAVKQRQLDVRVAAGVDNRLLRAIQRPVRRQTSAVLRRVGVADHDLMPSVDPRAIRRDRQQRSKRVGGAPEIVDAFEQRHGAQPVLRAGLERLDGEHVRRRLRHRRRRTPTATRGSCCPASSKVSSTSRTFVVRLEVGRRERLLIAERSHQERLPLRLIPFEVRSQTPMSRDRIERFGMSRRMLPEIEPDERQPECRGPPQHVGQSSVRNHRLPGFDERAITELQRFDEVRHADV